MVQIKAMDMAEMFKMSSWRVNNITKHFKHATDVAKIVCIVYTCNDSKYRFVVGSSFDFIEEVNIGYMFVDVDRLV